MKITNPLHVKFKQDVIILNSKNEFDIWWNYEKSIRPDIENMGSGKWIFKPIIKEFPSIIVRKYNNNGEYYRFEEEPNYYLHKCGAIIVKLTIEQKQEILKYLQQNYE